MFEVHQPQYLDRSRCDTVKTMYINGSLELIIHGENLFKSCENPIFKHFSQFESVSFKTIMEFKDTLTKPVETKIDAVLPEKLALVFDAWMAGISPYIAVFPTFSSDNGAGYNQILPGFSPMEE